MKIYICDKFLFSMLNREVQSYRPGNGGLTYESSRYLSSCDDDMLNFYKKMLILNRLEWESGVTDSKIAEIFSNELGISITVSKNLVPIKLEKNSMALIGHIGPETNSKVEWWLL